MKQATAFQHFERDTLQVSGRERLSWLNGVVTCDVNKLRVGLAAFGLSLNSKGKVQSDVWLATDGELVWLSVAQGQGEALCQTLERLLIMEDAEVRCVPEFACVSIHGAEAASAAARMAAVLRGGWGSLDLVTAGDALLIAPRDSMLSWYDGDVSLRSAIDVAVGTDAEWQAFRIAHGFPLFGVDYDQHQNAHDVSLERRAVSWSKGCYLGQEVVCMQDLRGKTKRRLAIISLPSQAVPAPLEPVIDGETSEVVGTISSFAESTPGGPVLALARLKTGSETSGALTVMGNLVTAKLAM